MRRSIAWTSISLALKTVSAECSRGLLANATNQYFEAQTNGTLSNFTALASNVTYIEDDKPVDIKTGALAQSVKIDRSSTFYDTAACSALAEFVSTGPNLPCIIHTRMLFDNSTSKITRLESIVTRPGDWAFNATGYAYWSAFENWKPIPKEKQDSRATIKAAGDAYFDRFNNVSVVIPIGTACTRLEGGSYTARGKFADNTCEGYPSTIKVTDRKYVVDEEMGVVSIFVGFPGLDRMSPKVPMPDSHIFRVEGGKIRYIHTVSKCEHPDCGLNRSSTFGMENQKRSLPVQLPVRLPVRPVRRAAHWLH